MPENSPHRAYLSLGSNIEPEQNLPAAVRLLADYGRVAATSRVWETAPVDKSAQPNFLNGAVLLETALLAEELRLDAIELIERSLGRVRDPADNYGPRTIDIDVTLFDCDVSRIGHRQIPDPSLLERCFVAIPLAEIDPSYVHPQVGLTLAEIAARFDAATYPMLPRPDVDLAAL
jgi:2-amino-4-hydroxy-6-hydroxymethyldihydropteridine diphosphokinase